MNSTPYYVFDTDEFAKRAAMIKAALVLTRAGRAGHGHVVALTAAGREVDFIAAAVQRFADFVVDAEIVNDFCKDSF